MIVAKLKHLLAEVFLGITTLEVQAIISLNRFLMSLRGGE